MEWGMQVAAFYQKISADNRISPVHISLYFVILSEVCSTGVDVVIPVREYLMVRSKICSTVTYHRCLRELHQYGYIDYRPSFATGRTRIEMINLSP